MLGRLDAGQTLANDELREEKKFCVVPHSPVGRRLCGDLDYIALRANILSPHSFLRGLEHFNNSKATRSMFLQFNSVKFTCLKKLLNVLTLSTLILIGCDEDYVPVRKSETKLHYYTESFKVDGFDYDPQYTVMYYYDNSGMLEKYTFYSYRPAYNQLKEERTFRFTYLEGRVDQIEGVLVNSSAPYVRYSYEYLPDGKVSKIKEFNTPAGTTSEATFEYQADDFIKVSYQYSNGNSFQYEFHFENRNILNDKTTRGAQLCSDGQYSYDNQKSPFQTLGYVDYLLFNLSVNNKLTESVNYVGCAFPTLIPESHEYEYGNHGFPTIAVTKYESGGSIKESRKNFYYKQVGAD